MLKNSSQMIQQFRLNHGLFLNGYSIKPSKQALFFKDAEWNINLYQGQPLVYTCINDCDSRTNLLAFPFYDSCQIRNDTMPLQPLQPSDVCINFPVAEITYNADLSDSLSKLTGDNETLYEIYGHLFAKKILVGGKLFIDDFKSVTSTTSTQIDLYKSYIIWVYDSAKYNEEIPFNNLTTLNFFPIRTSDGKRLDTPEKLTNWMINLYQNKSDVKLLDIPEELADWVNQNNLINIISYNDLIPISQSVDAFQTLDEKQPEVANFKEKMGLKEWVGDFHLSQGLIINKNYEIEIWN